MSTILDALRKIERDKRQRESGSARREVVEPAPPPVNRRLRLIAILAVGSAGILAGATLAIWSGGPRPVDELQVATRLRFAQPAATPVTPHSPPAAAPGTEKTRALLMHGGPRPRPLDQAQRRQYLPAGEKGDSPAGDGKAEGTAPPTAPASPPSRSELAVEGKATIPTDRQPQRAAQQPVVILAESPPGTAATGTGSEEALTDDKKAEELPTKLVDTGRSPPGVPKVALGMLQWSPEPNRRFAFISVDGGPFQKLREGERAQSLAITRIGKDSVTFKYETTLFVIRPRY